MEINKLGPNLWISHDWAPTHPLGSQTQPIRMSFSPLTGFITEINTPQYFFPQLAGGLVSDDPAGEESRCGGPGLAWLHVGCGCEAGWTYCQIL